MLHNSYVSRPQQCTGPYSPDWAETGLQRARVAGPGDGWMASRSTRYLQNIFTYFFLFDDDDATRSDDDDGGRHQQWPANHHGWVSGSLERCPPVTPFCRVLFSFVYIRFFFLVLVVGRTEPFRGLLFLPDWLIMILPSFQCSVFLLVREIG